MSAPYHEIETKLEAAFKAVIETYVMPATASGLAAGEVHTAITAQDIDSGDRVICECASARGVKGMIGNFYATHTVRIHTKANPTRSTALTRHRARVGYVRDLLMDSTLPSLLAAAQTDLTIQGIVSEIHTHNELGQDRKGKDHFVSELTMGLYCCPSA